jgi:hypothetical protein
VNQDLQHGTMIEENSIIDLCKGGSQSLKRSGLQLLAMNVMKGFCEVTFSSACSIPDAGMLQALDLGLTSSDLLLLTQKSA